LDLIFGDFEEFYKKHNRFYDRCAIAWKNGEEIGPIVFDYVIEMESFAFRFIDNFQLANDRIEELKRTEPKFFAF